MKANDLSQPIKKFQSEIKFFGVRSADKGDVPYSFNRSKTCIAVIKS